MGIVERINKAERRIVDLYNKLKNLPSGGGGEQVINEVTYSELSNLITNAELIPGAFYKILNADINLYGGTEVTLTAITSNELSLQGSGKFYCPKYDVSAESTGYGIWTTYMDGTFSNIVGTFTQGETVTANNGATAIYLAEGFLNYVSGDWSGATTISAGSTTANVSGFVSPSYSVGQVVHWGGKSWTNVNGNIGASLNKYTLNTEWTEIPFNETDYNVYIDEIQYDFGNDMIIYRKDRYNNVVSGSYQVFVQFIGNPIKDFRWGCGIDTNVYVGIKGNQVIDSYFETLNLLAKYIWFNELSQFSFFNSNTLSNNSYIEYNTLSNNSFIRYNTFSNNSSISYNTFSNGSSISYNTLSNGSYIEYNTLSNSNIQYNTFSNGFIQNNTLSSGSINNNTLSNGVYIYANTLSSSSINNNTLSNGVSIQSNTLSSYSNIQNNTFSNGSSIRYNTFSNDSSLQFSGGDVVSKTLTKLTMEGNNTSISISATIIFNQNISKTIFKREDGASRLQYVNNSDVVVITDANA